MAGPILLVEDNAQDEKLMLRALVRTNIANPIDVVRDGQQALDYLFRQKDYQHLAQTPLPVVILLDLNLPRINGLDVLAKIRSEPATQRIPVVVLTSSDDENDLIRTYDQGANSFVQKPLDFGEFASTVAQLGVYWVALNRAPVGGVD